MVGARRELCARYVDDVDDADCCMARRIRHCLVLLGTAPGCAAPPRTGERRAAWPSLVRPVRV